MSHMNFLSISKLIMEEGFGAGDVSIIVKFISDDYQDHQFGAMGGKEGLMRDVLSLHDAFPDIRFKLVNHIADGDTLWTHYIAAGTHTVPFMGLPPSGKSFSIDIIDILRFKGDKITEHWGAPGWFALLVQMGLLSSPPVTPPQPLPKSGRGLK